MALNVIICSLTFLPLIVVSASSIWSRGLARGWLERGTVADGYETCNGCKSEDAGCRC